MSKFFFFLVMVGVCTAAQAICPQDFYNRIENQSGPTAVQRCFFYEKFCEGPRTKVLTSETVEEYGLQTILSISTGCEAEIYYLLMDVRWGCHNGRTWANRAMAKAFSTQASHCGTCPPDGWLDTWREAFGDKKPPDDLNRCVQCNNYEDWADLLRFQPSEEELVNIRSRRNLPDVDFDIQRISNQTSDKINFDDYSVRVVRLPPRFRSPEDLLDHFRRNINSFLDNEIAILRRYSRDDMQAWQSNGPAPRGSIHVFDMRGAGPGIIDEQGAVIVSRSTPQNWTFTTVAIDRALPGEHPVSGHREFGIRSVGNGTFEIYTRGTDRTTLGIPDTLVASEARIYEGGDQLWRSFQRRLTDFINSTGGSAVTVNPRFHRPYWTSRDVQNCVSVR